jgi:hypothetical protein
MHPSSFFSLSYEVWGGGFLTDGDVWTCQPHASTLGFLSNAMILRLRFLEAFAPSWAWCLNFVSSASQIADMALRPPGTLSPVAASPGPGLDTL